MQKNTSSKKVLKAELDKILNNRPPLNPPPANMNTYPGHGTNLDHKNEHLNEQGGAPGKKNRQSPDRRRRILQRAYGGNFPTQGSGGCKGGAGFSHPNRGTVKFSKGEGDQTAQWREREKPKHSQQKGPQRRGVPLSRQVSKCLRARFRPCQNPPTPIRNLCDGEKKHPSLLCMIAVIKRKTWQTKRPQCRRTE